MPHQNNALFCASLFQIFQKRGEREKEREEDESDDNEIAGRSDNGVTMSDNGVTMSDNGVTMGDNGVTMVGFLHGECNMVE